MNLREFYKRALALGMISVADDNQLLTDFDDSRTPLLVKGKSVYLSAANMREEPNQRLFHPFVEPVSGVETNTFQRIRRYYEAAVSMRLQILVSSLINFSVNTDQHPKANSVQREILVDLGSFDNDLAKCWTDLIAKSVKVPTLKLMSTFGRNGAAVAGTKYNRANIVEFPVYTKLATMLSGGEAVSGVTKGRARGIVKVLEYVLPNINQTQPEVNETYSRGSSDPFGPRWCALLRSMYAIQARINEVAEALGEFCYSPEVVICDISAAAELANTVQFQTEIRSYTVPSNEGYSEPAQPPAAAPAPAAPRLTVEGPKPISRPAAPAAPVLHEPQPTSRFPPPRREAPAPAAAPNLVMMNVNGQQMLVDPSTLQVPMQHQQPQQPPMQQVMLPNGQLAWVPVQAPQQPGYPQMGYPQPGYAAPAPASPSLFAGRPVMGGPFQPQPPAFNPVGHLPAYQVGTAMANGIPPAPQQPQFQPQGYPVPGYAPAYYPQPAANTMMGVNPAHFNNGINMNPGGGTGNVFP